MVRYFAVVTNNAYLCIVVYKIVRIMCTRERELELGQKLEIVEDAERRIAKYEVVWEADEQDRASHVDVERERGSI